MVSSSLNRLTPGLVTMFSQPIRRNMVPPTVTRIGPLAFGVSPRLYARLLSDRKKRLDDAILAVRVYQQLLLSPAYWRGDVPREPVFDAQWRLRMRDDLEKKIVPVEREGLGREDVRRTVEALFVKFWHQGRLALDGQHLQQLMALERECRLELEASVSKKSLEALQSSLQLEKQSLQVWGRAAPMAPCSSTHHFLFYRWT